MIVSFLTPVLTTVKNVCNITTILFFPSFVNLANLTGIPAMTLPVGYNKDNLPVPVQIMASWWREDILLNVAYAIERNVVTKKPEVYFDITQ